MSDHQSPMSSPNEPQMAARVVAVISDERDFGIDFAGLFGTLARHKFIILLPLLVFMVLGVIAAIIWPPKYEADTTFIFIAHEQSAGGLSSILNQVGGLASIVGADLGGASTERTDEALAVLKSRAFAIDFIQNNNMMVEFYADQWDDQTGQWRDSEDHPTMLDAYNKFESSLFSLINDARSNTYIVRMKWRDPVLAAKWANQFVKVADAHLRREHLQTTERHLAYLTERLNDTPTTEVRNGITELIKTEMNRQMIADVNEEYMFKVIDPALVPEKPSYLKNLILMVLVWGLGGMLSFIILLRKYFVRRRAHAAPAAGAS